MSFHADVAVTRQTEICWSAKTMHLSPSAITHLDLDSDQGNPCGCLAFCMPEIRYSGRRRPWIHPYLEATYTWTLEHIAESFVVQLGHVMHSSLDGSLPFFFAESTLSHCLSIAPLVDGRHVDIQYDNACNLDCIANKHAAFSSVVRKV